VSSLLITADSVLTADGVVSGGAILVQDGVIAGLGRAGATMAPDDARHIDGSGLLLSPGLLDIQINGGFGHDFTHEPAAIWDVGTRLTEHGVTGFVPTVVTSTAEARAGMLAALAGGPPDGYRGATPLGAHFEGPFLSPDASGAHDRQYLRSPSEADVDVGTWSSRAGVRIVTLAPELEDALDLVRGLISRGVVVSAGHSAANYDAAKQGFDAGIMYATHLFNAMPPLGHREPGLVGAALADPRVTVGMIADGIHVHPAVIKLAANACGPARFSLVTDATAALGMPLGRYMLGGRDVVLDGTSVRLAGDGRLAGSALTMDEALRRFVAMTGWDAADALATMTSTPARLLGLVDRGTLTVGSRADMTLLTPEFKVVATFVGGEAVFGEWA
jgi:N-acetylglucosamine-6-phosphate deacetylase